MGTGIEAWAVPAAIAAIGTGAQIYTQRSAQKDQNAAMAAGMRDVQKRQRDADLKINEEIGALEGSTADDERAQSMQRFMDTLNTARRTTAGDPAVPGASDLYQQDVASSQAGVKNFGDQVAATLARINGATMQRTNENRGFARTGDEVSGIARNAEADAFLARLRASGIMPDPYINAAGQLATGVGTAMATRAPTQTPGRTPPYVPPSNSRTWGGENGFSPPPR
jgi:hypothetical protein